MTTQALESANFPTLRRRLLEWYAHNRRDLPWRRNRNPYGIWISEIMLQQTRVAVVVDRYQAFMTSFPTLLSLALAPEEDVLALWSGLGYYRRARMLHQAAKLVAETHQGNLPASPAELRKLPGIGAYTAAAIASIAHGEAIAVVDGNVERVLCRLAGWEAGNTKGGTAFRRKIEDLAASLLDSDRPGDFNQAMMELGATVCLPRNPQCLVCPLASGCMTRGEHKTPARPPMRSREAAYALSLRAGHLLGENNREVLLEQRSASLTVMPGLWELPALRDHAVPAEALHVALRHAIMQVNYYVSIRNVPEEDIETLTVLAGERSWIPLGQAATMALTGLTRKVLSRAGLLSTAPPSGIAPPSKEDVL